MSVPDPYRQPTPPHGYPPHPTPLPGQPGAPAGGYPPGAYPAAPFPAYPQAAHPYPAQAYPSQPNYPQPTSYPQAGYPQAYGAPAYPQQPAYPPQPAYPQPAYPQAMPTQAATPGVSDFQQQAFQAPNPVVGQPVQPLAKPMAVPAAQPVGVTPVAKGPQPVATPAPTAAPTTARPMPIPATPSTTTPNAATTSVATPVATPTVNPGAGGTNTPTPANKARPLPVSAAATAARPVLVTKSDKNELLVEDRPEGEEEGEEKAPDAVKKAPPWLISLVVHMVLFIILGLIFIVSPGDRQVALDVVWAERLGEQLLDSSVLTSSPDPIETLDVEYSEDLTIVEDPLAAPPELLIDPLLPGTTASSDISAPTIGMALSGREKGAKQALLAAYGGTKLTEEAVRNGLLWLKKNQRADGSWSMMGPYSDGANQENATAATAMALLAFQGAGNTHRDGEFKDVVAKAWKWLLARQNADGDFIQESIYNARLYTQAQCTIAICELYGMTKDEQYRKPAQLAIDYAIKAQDPTGGGWRYTPRQDSDLSVTGWFVMALQSALMAGLEVPSPQLDSISKFLDATQHNDGAQYSYKPGQGPTLPMTAEGLLSRQYLGWKHADPRMQAGVQYLLQNKISYGDQNVYYWYYGSQVLHHMGGRQWDEWNAVMREALPRAQTQTGKEAGSWAPSNDRWGAHGGRLYVTCLTIYNLEVYYRHLPIYKHQIQ